MRQAQKQDSYYHQKNSTFKKGKTMHAQFYFKLISLQFTHAKLFHLSDTNVPDKCAKYAPNYNILILRTVSGNSEAQLQQCGLGRS